MADLMATKDKPGAVSTRGFKVRKEFCERLLVGIHTRNLKWIKEAGRVGNEVIECPAGIEHLTDQRDHTSSLVASSNRSMTARVSENSGANAEEVSQSPIRFG